MHVSTVKTIKKVTFRKKCDEFSINAYFETASR